MFKQIQATSAVALILAQVILPSLSFASLPGRDSDDVRKVSMTKAAVASAIIFQDGQPLCQMSTINRPDLLPNGLISLHDALPDVHHK